MQHYLKVEEASTRIIEYREKRVDASLEKRLIPVRPQIHMWWKTVANGGAAELRS